MSISNLPWEILSLLGSQAVVTAVLAFFGKAWLENKLQNERAKLDKALQEEKARLEASLQQASYMHKVRFDTEFKIYSELWKELCKVQVALLAFLGHNEKESDRPSLQDKRRNVDAAVESLNSSVEISRPFFAASVAKQLFDLARLAKEQSDSDEKDREERKDRKERGEVLTWTAKMVRERYFRYPKMRRKIDDICESIRMCVTGTVVIERENDEVPYDDLPANTALEPTR